MLAGGGELPFVISNPSASLRIDSVRDLSQNEPRKTDNGAEREAVVPLKTC
jgi:hypothetical protein